MIRPSNYSLINYIMDTTQKKEIANPTLQDQDDGEASTEIPSPSKDSEVDEEAKKTTAKQREEEPQEKTTDKDAGEEDVRLEAVLIAGKKRHLIKEATLFPRFFIMFGVRMVAGNSDLKLSQYKFDFVIKPASCFPSLCCC